MTMYYDKHGYAIVHLQNKHLFDMKGKPVAFIYNKAVYNLRGKLLGYADHGWIRDKHNHAVLYTDNYSGFGPLPPVHYVAPIPCILAVPPVPPIPPIAPIPPVASSNWSVLSADAYFNQ
ncbi:MAG: hypothetical protein IIW48_12560 [Clostridia bacterium]|nr:hypothetical protein [Clostridia bacterium]